MARIKVRQDLRSLGAQNLREYQKTSNQDDVNILIQYFKKLMQKPMMNKILNKNGIPQCYASHTGA